MIRSIIIDDERPSREALRNYLQEYCPDIEIVDDADSMKTGLMAIKRQLPDLVFLDIDMPNGNGFDLLRNLDRITFKIIFVTAHSEYAVKAFRFFATDYLLKPVDIDELMEATAKVKMELQQGINNKNIEELLCFASKGKSDFNIIVIPDKKGFEVVQIQDILYCEADGYCTRFFLKDGQTLISSKNLKVYEEILEAVRFQRVHHSYIVNLNHVRGYHHDGTIALPGNHTVPLGNVYKKKFLEKFT